MADCECYIVPIDVCYELVGLLRQSWRGFDGGREAHEELDELFGRAPRPGPGRGRSQRPSVVADLDITVAGAPPSRSRRFRRCRSISVSPTTGGLRIQALALRAQVRIEPQRRRYSSDESERLVELFGQPAQWGESLRPFLWTQVATVVGSFRGTSEVELALPCTYDFEVSAARYLHGLDDGDIPLVLLFNGTIFRTGPGGSSSSPCRGTPKAAISSRYRYGET